ncbi:hypothetical protein LCGC14_3043540 [marine sediment metagenome]|uniref:Uncharacterized protein n=1 Tax=marine sediment metagenome TaxID=412755 RepID=A0A0F8WPE2_9ZZZZ
MTCKIREHKSYFKQFELFLEIPIIVQSFLYIKFRMRNKNWTIILNKVYLDIIDLTVLEEFKPISITLGIFLLLAQLSIRYENYLILF